MELDDALELARRSPRAVMITIRKDGRPQVSNVLHALFDDGVVRVSTTAGRAKYRNLVRQPWAALHVTAEDFGAYAVLEGDVELSDVASDPEHEVVDELVAHFRAAVGEHDDWAAFRQAMVDEHRVVIRLTPTRAYGMLQLPSTSGTE